jgi:hypothetical protein
VLGRFISADSIVPDGVNPQVFNRYAYANNSPLNYIDPNGHEGCSAFTPGACSIDELRKLLGNNLEKWNSFGWVINHLQTHLKAILGIAWSYLKEVGSTNCYLQAGCYATNKNRNCANVLLNVNLKAGLQVIEWNKETTENTAYFAGAIGHEPFHYHW